MADKPEQKEQLEKWMPVLFVLVAIGNAWMYSTLDSGVVKQYCPVLFAFSLGMALILWGSAAQEQGKIRGARVIVLRAENPRVFNSLLYGKYFIPGVIMILAGAWYAFMGGP